MNSWLSFTIASLLAYGCEQPPSSAPAGAQAGPGVSGGPKPAPSGPPVEPSNTALTCALNATRSGDGFALSLTLSNPDKRPVVVTYFHPISFALEAWVGSKRVQVTIPAHDSPVVPRTLTLPPAKSIELPTPISLSFTDKPLEPKKLRPHHFWLHHKPSRVRLRALRVFDARPGLICSGWLEPKP